MKTNLGVSPNTVGRLPKYLLCLYELEEKGIDHISSAAIADRLNLTPSQVRQDLSRFGSYGAQGYGYDIRLLAKGIRSILGIDKEHSVIVVGVGSIGSALLTHLNFEEHNYRVLAGFDTNPEIVGERINGTTILSAEELPDYLKEHYVDLCVLTVSEQHAKNTALMLADCGVPAIWNFTNVDLELGGHDILVENIHFLDSLFSLTFYLEATSKVNNQ